MENKYIIGAVIAVILIIIVIYLVYNRSDKTNNNANNGDKKYDRVNVEQPVKQPAKQLANQPANPPANKKASDKTKQQKTQQKTESKTPQKPSSKNKVIVSNIRVQKVNNETQVSWDPVPNATHYTMYYSEKKNFDKTKVNTHNPIEDNTMTLGSDVPKGYYFKVSATRDVNGKMVETDLSNEHYMFLDAVAQ